jgi:predicted TIM-barrel fold metal-dependent hydrolase
MGDGTPSGPLLFLSHAGALAALLTFGIDRIMFSVDYPYAPNAKGRDLLDGISLAPADMAKLTHSNADALLKLKVGAG